MDLWMPVDNPIGQQAAAGLRAQSLHSARGRPLRGRERLSTYPPSYDDGERDPSRKRSIVAEVGGPCVVDNRAPPAARAPW
jgi:hypothetical protein